MPKFQVKGTAMAVVVRTLIIEAESEEEVHALVDEANLLALSNEPLDVDVAPEEEWTIQSVELLEA